MQLVAPAPGAVIYLLFSQKPYFHGSQDTTLAFDCSQEAVLDEGQKCQTHTIFEYV